MMFIAGMHLQFYEIYIVLFNRALRSLVYLNWVGILSNSTHNIIITHSSKYLNTDLGKFNKINCSVTCYRIVAPKYLRILGIGLMRALIILNSANLCQLTATDFI